MRFDFYLPASAFVFPLSFGLIAQNGVKRRLTS